MVAGSEKKTAVIYTKLLELQTELKAPKNEQGRFGKHRNVEGILEALKPLLKKYGLTFVLDNEILGVEGRTYVQAIARLYYAGEAGLETIEVKAQAWEGDISRGLDSAQITGSASSYARKYALGGMFAIDDTKDPDSHKDDPRPPAKKEPAIQLDGDPATPRQKQQLKNMMTALEMDNDAMGLMVESVLGKPKVETLADYNAVVEAMEETSETV